MPKRISPFLNSGLFEAKFSRRSQASSVSDRRGMCLRPTYGFGSSSSPFGTLRRMSLSNVAELLHLPAIGDVAEGEATRGLFVAGEAEDESLAVEGAGHCL